MEEIYKGYKIKVERDNLNDSPFEYCDYEGVGLVERGTLWIDGGFTAEEFRDMSKADYYWLPLYKYSHSGVTYNTIGFSCPWDSGQAGYVFISKKIALEDFGIESAEDSVKFLTGLVNTLAMHSEGNVFMYSIRSPDGCMFCGDIKWEFVTSCHGMYCYRDDVMARAKDEIDRFYSVKDNTQSQTVNALESVLRMVNHNSKNLAHSNSDDIKVVTDLLHKLQEKFDGNT